MLIGSDRFAALRSRPGRGTRARCLAVPLRRLVVPLASAGVLAIALAGCGGSHAAGPAAASVSPGTAGDTSATSSTGTTTGTSTAGAPVSGAQPGTTSSSNPSASGQGSGSSNAGTPATGGAVRTGSKDPAPSRGGSDAGKGTTHGSGTVHGKSKSETAAGGTGAGGSGSGKSDLGSNSGSGGGSGSSNAPNANTGVPFEVSTTSMEPTFQPETKIYYDPTRTHPQVGEVVVFYPPAGAEGGACGEVLAGGRACATPIPGMTKSKEISFKRVVGLPGDSIAIREGHVIRNGQPEPEPPTLPCEKDEKLNCEFPTPITVPAGDYYLMADNRGLAREDSRIFGAVPQEYILGTVEGG